MKVPGSFSDTEEPYASTEEESVSARSDLQERMESLDEILSEAGEEVETEEGEEGSHILTLEHDNVAELLNSTLDHLLFFQASYSEKQNRRKWNSSHKI